MKIIERFADEVIAGRAYKELNRVYIINKIKALVGGEDQKYDGKQSPIEQLVQIAANRKIISDDNTSRGVLNDRLYDLRTPTPSKVNETPWQKMQKSANATADWFYKLCVSNSYAKKGAIARNIVFSGKNSKNHESEIMVDLSKPEKDPKVIAAAAHSTGNKYPQCVFYLESEGYVGGYRKNVRSNLRMIHIMVSGRPWDFQYLPYAYFNEHCIFLGQKYIPIIINQQALINLVDIEKQLPGYFVGPNVDLPIVGGSMFAYEHYQGGRHIFLMMKAKIKKAINFDQYPEVKAGVVDWPMSDSHLISKSSLDLIDLGSKIIDSWDHYSDQDHRVKVFDDGTRHHTVTPIMHREGEDFVLNLVLRDNNTSVKYPLRISHPYAELWHIKEENTGSIGVMGRAILPGRLKKELGEIRKCLLNEDNEIADSHLDWSKRVRAEHQTTRENIDSILQQALVEAFDQVFECVGVFKNNKDGETG